MWILTPKRKQPRKDCSVRRQLTVTIYFYTILRYEPCFTSIASKQHAIPTIYDWLKDRLPGFVEDAQTKLSALDGELSNLVSDLLHSSFRKAANGPERLPDN